MHPFMLCEMAKAHQSDLLREAQQERWARKARAGDPRVIASLLERLGAAMIRVGEQIQRRYAAQSTGRLGWAEQYNVSASL